MSTIVVSGAIANKYLKAGEAWHRLQWVLGLKRLGFQVFFVEQISRAGCVDTAGAVAAFQQDPLLWSFLWTDRTGRTVSRCYQRGRTCKSLGVAVGGLVGAVLPPRLRR
jgi:hypothetical protein